MIDLNLLVNRMRTDGTVATVARNAARQFGLGARRYIGAEILPERIVNANVYREERIRYRRIIAVDGTRYSPVEIRGGALTGSVLVELGESQTGSELTGQDLDVLMDILGEDREADAIAQITQWEDETIVLPLAEKNELQRWQAITNGVVTRLGSNNYTEPVQFPNPAGTRTVAGGTWSDPTYDPLPDILAHKTRMAGLGYTLARAVASTRVINILLANPKMQLRMGGALLTTSGQIQTVPRGNSLADLNALFAREGLPALEPYDLTYATNTATLPFLRTDALVLIAQTDRNERVDLGDARIEDVPGTLGYVGMGRPAGLAQRGRHVLVEYQEKKPVGLYGEGYQTSFPVITEPDAIGVITGIN